MDHPVAVSELKKRTFVERYQFLGKTLLSKAIAYEFQLNVIVIQYVELWTMLLSGPETKIHDAFDKARQMEPCVLFFNDLDSIGKKCLMRSVYD
jgi:SpoVK/Ycf46/Vps4 family AAA+-type ATPase